MSKYKAGDWVEFTRDAEIGGHKKGERYQVTALASRQVYGREFSLDCDCDYLHDQDELKLSSDVTPVLAGTAAPAEHPVHQTPEIHCACCGARAPRIVLNNLGNLLRLNKVSQPDLRGWLIMSYPFRDMSVENGLKPRTEGMYIAASTPFAELTEVCPKCAPQVLGTVKHMADGWRR